MFFFDFTNAGHAPRETEVTKMAKPVTLPDDLKRERIIDAKQTAALMGMSVVHFRRLYRSKKVPTPVLIGERKYGWQVGLILDHIAMKAAA